MLKGFWLMEEMEIILEEVYEFIQKVFEELCKKGFIIYDFDDVEIEMDGFGFGGVYFEVWVFIVLEFWGVDYCFFWLGGGSMK